MSMTFIIIIISQLYIQHYIISNYGTCHSNAMLQSHDTFVDSADILKQSMFAILEKIAGVANNT